MVKETRERFNNNLKELVDTIQNELVEIPIREIIFPIGTSAFSANRTIEDVLNFKKIMVENDGFTDRRILNIIDKIVEELIKYLRKF